MRRWITLPTPKSYGYGLLVVLPGIPFAWPRAAFGASYPERPIRLVVPSVPGGGTDLSMRVIAPKLAELLEQQIVIDNRGGAAGNIGAEIVAKAPPGQLQFASAGLGSAPHLMMALFNNLAGLDMIHVAYKGRARR